MNPVVPTPAFPALSTPGLSTPDLPAPDLSTPDLSTPDLPAPDLPAPDLPAPDLPTPGLSTPGLSTPELPAPDLPIVETFYSVQGEGHWAGHSAFFIRLGGCDVGCSWCDTKHSWDASRHRSRSIAELVAAAAAVPSAHVIVTGGEPTLHDLQPLTQALRAAGCQPHLETSGAYALRGDFQWVTLSPKTVRSPHPSLYGQVHELKVVVADRSDLEWAESQAALVSPTVVKFLQPEWSSPQSQALVYDYVLHHPTWRISLQTHKILKVR